MTPCFWGRSSHSHHHLRGQLGFQEGVSPQLGGFTSCSHLMRGRLGSSRVHDPPTGGALPLLSTYSNILGALMFEGWASQESVSLPIAGLPSCSPPDNSKCRG